MSDKCHGQTHLLLFNLRHSLLWGDSIQFGPFMSRTPRSWNATKIGSCDRKPLQRNLQSLCCKGFSLNKERKWTHSGISVMFCHSVVYTTMRTRFLIILVTTWTVSVSYNARVLPTPPPQLIFSRYLLSSLFALNGFQNVLSQYLHEGVR
jgi:hypothetical protein